MPYRPDPEERHKGLDNLFYEIQQLLYSTTITSGDTRIANALVESRLLHVRVLLDVFARSESDHDDVLAAHYGFPLSPVRLEAPYFERLNKDLAHLTYSRTRRTLATKGWPTSVVVVPVLSRCKEFIEHLLEQRGVFHVVGPTEWRQLGLEVAAFLESVVARQGV
jgi:hypothetical protein